MAYGEEGASNPGTSFAITGNTIVNDDPSGRFLLDPATQPTLSGNSVWGLPATGDTVLLANRPSLDIVGHDVRQSSRRIATTSRPTATTNNSDTQYTAATRAHARPVPCDGGD